VLDSPRSTARTSEINEKPGGTDDDSASTLQDHDHGADPAGSAPAVWGPRDLYNLLATGEETNKAFFQFEAIVPPGGGPPAHVHSREDESFYVVRGSLETLVGDSLYRAKAGDFVYIPPRNCPPIQE
jgi:quercetin dioxygenase-like cupin family protein